MVGPPDFVGVGAQRAGTTWWFRLLLQHPAIEGTPAPRQTLNRFQTFKELHFFNDFCRRPLEAEDVARYHAMFPRTSGVVRGEWTPRYMYDPWTPRLLREAAPETRVLVLLRDPIERWRSGVAHQLGSTPNRPAEFVSVDAVNRSRYAQQLRRILELFPPEQVLVLQFERCRTDTAGEFARTLRFLGVRDDAAPVDPPPLPTIAVEKPGLWPALAEELRFALEPDVRELQSLVPGLDTSLWPHFSHLRAMQPTS